jgi:hypothetical protein
MTALPEQGAPKARGLRSWSPIAGTLFVVRMVVRTFSVARVPNPAVPPQTIARYLADGGNHMLNLAGAGGGR